MHGTEAFVKKQCGTKSGLSMDCVYRVVWIKIAQTQYDTTKKYSENFSPVPIFPVPSSSVGWVLPMSPLLLLLCLCRKVLCPFTCGLIPPLVLPRRCCCSCVGYVGSTPPSPFFVSSPCMPANPECQGYNLQGPWQESSPGPAGARAYEDFILY